MEKMNPVKPLFPNLAENLWWSWNLAMNHLQSHIVTNKNEGEIQMSTKDPYIEKTKAFLEEQKASFSS